MLWDGMNGGLDGIIIEVMEEIQKNISYICILDSITIEYLLEIILLLISSNSSFSASIFCSKPLTNKTISYDNIYKYFDYSIIAFIISFASPYLALYRKQYPITSKILHILLPPQNNDVDYDTVAISSNTLFQT